MKKVFSIILCLAIVFSVCSFSLTANAEKLISETYCFNNDTFVVRFQQERNRTDSETMTAKLFFDVRPEGYPYNSKLVTEYGEGDLEYIIEDFLLEKLTSYQISIMTSINFVNCNETQIAYILSKIDAPLEVVDCGILEYDDLGEINGISDMTPIVDALLESSCKDTLNSFAIVGKKIAEIDNRVFTDFPNMITVNLECCNLWNYSTNGKTYDPASCMCYVPIDVNDFGDIFMNYGNPTKFLLHFYQNNLTFSGDENLTVNISQLGNSICVEHRYDYNGFSAFAGSFHLGYVISGDATGDGYIDSFDVATATEYVNNFEEPEDAAVMAAMDVVEDGYIDATDLAYISYIANYEG